jgi:hypothetical protein
VNPLAGCLPTLATIPVFIGLYRCAASASRAATSMAWPGLAWPWRRRAACDPALPDRHGRRLLHYPAQRVQAWRLCRDCLDPAPTGVLLRRALTKAADDGLLTSGFFWIPSLGGPTTMTARLAVRGLAALSPLQPGCWGCWGLDWLLGLASPALRLQPPQVW